MDIWWERIHRKLGQRDANDTPRDLGDPVCRKLFREHLEALAEFRWRGEDVFDTHRMCFRQFDSRSQKIYFTNARGSRCCLTEPRES
jgi:hypothetical protein